MWLRITAAFVLVLGGATGLAAPAAAQPAPLRQSDAFDVTLPTGDKVHVEGERVSMTPAPGRDPAFSVTHDRGDLYVIPDDRFSDDPARYNVTALHENRRPAARPEAPGDLVTVHLKSIARDGRPGLGVATFLDVEDGTRGISRRSLPGDADAPCTDDAWGDARCIRLPRGTYSILGLIKTLPSWAPSDSRETPLNYSLVGYPEIEITGDTEIVLDAREATEMDVDTPEHATKRNPGAISHLRWTRAPEKGAAVDDGVVMRSNSKLEERMFLQPTAEVRTGAFEIYTRWRLEAPAITMRSRGVALEPRYYDAAYFSDVSAQFPKLDGRARLRVADGDRPGADLRGRLALVQRKDGESVAEQSNRAAEAGARMVAVYNDKPGVNAEPGGYGVQLKVPTVWLSREEGRALLGRKHATVTATGVVDSPYLYELVYVEKGRIPKDLHYVARTRNLARIDTAYHGTDSVTTARYSQRPWEDFSITYSHPFVGAPRKRVEYLSADPETLWSARAITPELPYNHAFPQPDTPHIRMSTDTRQTYRPGSRQRHSWFEAPLAGGVTARTPVARDGDRMRLAFGLVDAEGNYSDVGTSDFAAGFATDFRVFRDGRLIVQTPDEPNGTLTTTPDDAVYRVEYDTANNATWARMSTRTRTSWTFRSAHTTQNTVVPLLLAGYDADLDLNNRSRSGRLKLTVRHQDGSRTPLRHLSLESSYDDGETWTDVRLRHGVAQLRGKGTVSLRIRAEDTSGTTLSQEIIRAFDVRRHR